MFFKKNKLIVEFTKFTVFCSIYTVKWGRGRFLSFRSRFLQNDLETGFSNMIPDSLTS